MTQLLVNCWNASSLTNMVAAGAIAVICGVATPDALEAGMQAVVPAHRSERIAANLTAVRSGYEWARSQARV
jgi:Pyruvate/2-oxoacid:ferredoxin oxidoreductase gamma subunit